MALQNSALSEFFSDNNVRLKKTAFFAQKVIKLLWDYELDFRVIADQTEDIVIYRRLISELDCFLMDFFEKKNCLLQVTPVFSSLASQEVDRLENSSEDDSDSDDFALIQ